MAYTIIGSTNFTVVADTSNMERKAEMVMAGKAGCSYSPLSKHVKKKLNGRKMFNYSELGRKAISSRSGRLKMINGVSVSGDITQMNPRHGLQLLHSWTRDSIRGILPGLRRKMDKPVAQ
ncbi:hypothetical protein ILYODFUR_006749 [Ilyodon furcidens]|uniref:Uncharacterized protein n=1 Tax=Ilyodon furcidens TaxID=33524 RepID=A0ABV0UQT1_9TELE